MAKEKDLVAEIQGGRAANRNLASRLKKLDSQSIQQQEIVYNQVCIAGFNIPVVKRCLL